MAYFKILPIGLLCCILISCKARKVKNMDLPAESTFIFGSFHGHCMGDCVTLYKISNNKLYADGLQRLPEPDQLTFGDMPLGDSKYKIAKALMDAFPSALLNEKEETIGCPDCADQGGYYLEWHSGNTIQRWKIDTNQSNLPAYLSKYAEKIEKTLASLRK